MKSIEKALNLKSELDALRPLKKDDEVRIMQKFRLDWNYHSNHLEGNSLTYGETKALIYFGLTAQGKPLKDHFEITGHDEAVKLIIEIVKQDRPFTENFIRELHKMILKDPYEVDAITPGGQPTKKWINVGKYKSTPNHVKTKTGEIFRFATAEETPALMKDLLDWYRTQIAKVSFNPVLLAAEFHYKFIRIHPFDDGNGRTARLLMNFILMQHGYPPVIIKSDDKSNYFSALQQADSGILVPFIDYILNNLVNSLEIMIKGAKGESIEEPDDIDKEISLLEQKLNQVSEPIEISKSKEAILNIFDNSVVSLSLKFLEKAGKFGKFYLRNGFSISINRESQEAETNKGSVINKAREKINDNTFLIKIEFQFIVFSQKGFRETNYYSSIDCHFMDTKYKVTDSKEEVSFEKFYSEQLSDEEINALVNSEVRRHKNEIERQIEQIRKSQ